MKKAYRVLDDSAPKTTFGIAICDESIDLQEEIYKAKEKLDASGEEWFIDDIFMLIEGCEFYTIPDYVYA